MMRLSRFVRLAVILTSALFLFLSAQSTAMAVDCFTCHDRGAFQKRVKHQPAAKGDCRACHSPHVAKHSGLLQQEVQTLCYSCHPDAAAAHRQGVVHQPVRKGECIACHDPHSSEQAGLLNKRSPDNCFTCHSDLPKKFKYTHTPYAKGQCSSCHQPHQSSHAYLLARDSDSLCLGCHSVDSVRQKHPNYPAEPVNCSSCHSPHGSNRPALVRNILHEPYAAGCKDCHVGKGSPVTVDTCLECHSQVGEQMASSHNHLVRYGNNGCLACHSPHAGDNKRLLKGKQRHVCGNCHEATFRRRDEAGFKHTMEGSCSDCHAPHGSNHPAMARAPINTVCVSCHVTHDQFTHPIGENVFDPRTGQMMTCASCHASKGTDNEYHLKFSGKRDLCVQCHRDH
jgi:predicted CXXCH cytochrome family protein